MVRPIDGGLRYAHFAFPVFQVWDFQVLQCGRVWWKEVHRAHVLDELLLRNPAAATLVRDGMRVNDEGVVNLAKYNSLFNVIGFHPTEDTVYFDVASNVCAYSIVDGTIKFVSPRQCFNDHVFPYVHPLFTVWIPQITTPTQTAKNAAETDSPLVMA